MADKHELLILPNNVDSSIVLSGGRSSLFARGRKDSAVLVISLVRVQLSSRLLC